MNTVARSSFAVSFLAALALALAGCGGEGSGQGDGSGRGGRSRATKDRGTSSMQLGDRAWTGSSARARLSKTNSLRITTSHSEAVDGKRRREALTIVIDDYKGVGQYTASSRGSNFVAVSIDLGDAEDAKTDDDIAKEVTNALTGSQVLMLMGLVVNITAANDTQVEGTFEYTPRAGSKQPAISDGRFRALVRD